MKVPVLKRKKETTLLSNKKKDAFLFFVAGILFAILWSSASTATKIGLQVAQPFTIAIFRFFIAGTVMLIIAHLFLRKRLPSKREWRCIMIYGLLNISIYLGCYVIAMTKVSAGIGSLAIAANPVFINIMLVFWAGHKMKWYNVSSLLLCLAGVYIATMPLLKDNLATIPGILILLAGMVSYSVGAIYYSRAKWNDLDNITINAWQTLFGGLFLLPVMIYTYHSDKNQLNAQFFRAVCWLAFAVSISAMLLWLYLLKNHLSKGYYWLFLCPVTGFIIAAIFTHEPLGLLTGIGVVLVIAGLYITLRKTGNDEIKELEDMNA